MTRALHLVTSTDRRGAEVFAAQLVDELGGPPDHELCAIAASRNVNPLDIEVLGRGRSDPRGVARLLSKLREAEVLVAHGSSALIHGALASTIARRPFVYRTIGDPAVWGRVTASSLRIGLPLRRAAAVTALYPASRDHLVAEYGLRSDAVTVIPNAVPVTPAVSAEERVSARRRWDLDPELAWVGFLGALSEEKGVMAAIRAVALDESLGLLVAGGGPQEADAKAAAAELLGDRARFVGVLEGSRLAMAAVDVVIVPSRTEGIPAVTIEAGLAGLPVVATRVGGVAAVVVDAMTGALVDTAEPEVLRAAVLRALEHRDEWGAAARERCLAHFTLAPVAAQWSELLAGVVASAASSR